MFLLNKSCEKHALCILWYHNRRILSREQDTSPVFFFQFCYQILVCARPNVNRLNNFMINSVFPGCSMLSHTALLSTLNTVTRLKNT